MHLNIVWFDLERKPSYIIKESRERSEKEITHKRNDFSFVRMRVRLQLQIKITEYDLAAFHLIYIWSNIYSNEVFTIN